MVSFEIKSLITQFYSLQWTEKHHPQKAQPRLTTTARGPEEGAAGREGEESDREGSQAAAGRTPSDSGTLGQASTHWVPPLCSPALTLFPTGFIRKFLRESRGGTREERRTRPAVGWGAPSIRQLHRLPATQRPGVQTADEGQSSKATAGAAARSGSLADLRTWGR